MHARYFFRTVQRHDLPMLRAWLETPEPSRWWGDAEAERTLIGEDLAGDAMRQWIISCGDRAFAYAQAYEVHAWPQPHLADLPHGAMAIDAFIGVPEMIGRGHGGKFLRQLAERLLAEGAPLIAIDPARDNERAQRAYRKAGFRPREEAETEAGPVILMAFSKS
jgi:aminoglycoside 6'-N-acetyltransferase